MRAPSKSLHCTGQAPTIIHAEKRARGAPVLLARLAVLGGCDHLPQDQVPKPLLSKLLPFIDR